MKILILYRNNKGNYNHFCNVDFYKYLKEIPLIDVKFYGCQVDQLFPSLCVKKFNKDITMKELYEIYNFDVIIVAGKNRTYYNSSESQSWLPSDFDKYKCLKVLVEPDFHKYRKDSWFIDRGISAILHRHKSNVIRGVEDFPELKHFWLPFSVDTNIFKNENKNREEGVCFVGNSKANAYYFRQIAGDILKDNGLLKYNGQAYELDYIDILKKYDIYLNGSSIYTIDCAKAFEIIASGGILLTNDIENGFKELFGNCFITYKNDFSNIIRKTKRVLNNKNLKNKLVEKGQNVVLKKHTHLKRCKDLIKILKGLLLDYKKHKNGSENINNTNCPDFFDVPSMDFKKDSITAKQYVELLQKNNIDVCLLKETCYNAIKQKEFNFPLVLGVSDLEKTKNFSQENVYIYKIPKKTKTITVSGTKVLVPFPVIKYLSSLNYDVGGLK